jgi:hypothetical protein
MKFPSDMGHRTSVSLTDKLMIKNIDTGATEYTTVLELFAAITGFELANANIQNHISNNDQAHSDYLKNNANDSSSGEITASDFILS